MDNQNVQDSKSRDNPTVEENYKRIRVRKWKEVQILKIPRKNSSS